MKKSTTGRAQTWWLDYFWAKIDIESVPARRFWIYFQNWQVLKLKVHKKTYVSMSRKNGIFRHSKCNHLLVQGQNQHRKKSVCNNFLVYSHTWLQVISMLFHGHFKIFFLMKRFFTKSGINPLSNWLNLRYYSSLYIFFLLAFEFGMRMNLGMCVHT